MKIPRFILAALSLVPVAGQAADFWVSPQGNDRSPGTQQQPFATLERVHDAERAARAASPREAVTVWLGGGDYLLGKPFVLTAADSGTEAAPTTYRAVEGQTPRVLGARKLTASAFQPVTDPTTLARVAAAAKGKVVALDLAALHVEHAQRFKDVFTDQGGLVDLFVAGRRMPLSRFPNVGYMTMKRVLDNAGGIKDGNWSNVQWEKVNQGGQGGTFEYREEFYAEHARWVNALDHGVWLKGYWRIPWQNEALRVGAINPEQHTVTFAKPNPGGIGNKYTRPAGNGKEPYWVMNLLEEIDQPGEWCVDFTDHKLYFYPPVALGNAEILLADADAAVIGIDGGAHIVLRGLLLEGNLGDGVSIKDGEADLVAGCTVRNVDKYGVRVDGGKNDEVLSNDLYNLGCGGVWLAGGDEKSTPRTPAGHRVINNHIHHFSQIELVYTPGVNCGYTGGGGGGHHTAVGMLVAHNLIHDTPHAGVLFGSWDNTFEYNEIFRWAVVSNDIGAFYSYEQFEGMGNTTFRYNFLHNSEQGDGFYWDHDHRDQHVYGNVVCLESGSGRGTGYLYKIGDQPKNPQTIDCTNNIAIHCNTGFNLVTVLPNQGPIANNAAIECPKTPFNWREVKDGKEAATSDYSGAKNMTYSVDPGFANLAKLNFQLQPGAQLLKDLPGFKPIPLEKIGLYVDEYRRKLPTDEELDRYDNKSPAVGFKSDILDRGN